MISKSFMRHTFHLFILFVLLAVAAAQDVPAEEGTGVRRAVNNHLGVAEEEEININFVDVDIATLIKFVSDVTGKNFVYDEKVRGKVTVIAPTKLSVEETFSLFTSILELKGFTLIPTESAYKIIPSAMAKQGSTEIVEEQVRRFDETYIIRLVPLDHVSAQEVLQLLRPLISRNGYIASFNPKNALIVVDTALNIEKILRIIEVVDKGVEGEGFEFIYLRYADADAVSRILGQVVGQVGTYKPQKGKVPAAPPFQGRSFQGGGVKIIPDSRLNALIIVGPSAQIEEYKRFIAALDVELPATSSHINVHYLENADAEELAKVLEGVIKTGNSAKPGGTKKIAPPTEFRDRIAITPDKGTNSLVIIASPSDYQNLVQVIKKLDRRPKQVFVEAMITEVSIDKALDLGSRWRATGTKGGEPVAIGGVGTVDSSAIQTIINGMTGLTVGGLANFITVPVTTSDGSSFDLTAPGFAALFSLAEFKDVINVLSTPHILTSDNSEAEIMVGENVPFISKFEREATSANQPVLQSIERKDVGITLNIKPQISEGGYVKLDIYQEISALSTSAVQAADIITAKRSAKTSVVIKDGQTVVIGGLIQERNINNVTKVPLLGDIPIIGWLFKYNIKQKQKTNLLVFLTPHIIKDLGELDDIKKMKEGEYDSGREDREGGKEATDKEDGDG